MEKEKVVRLTMEEQRNVPFEASANVLVRLDGGWFYADFDGETALPIQDEDQSGDYVVADVGEIIAGRLTDEDIAVWNEGEATANVDALVEEFGGAFQVWGSRTGGEPLTVTWIG